MKLPGLSSLRSAFASDSSTLMRQGGLMLAANVLGGALGYAYQVLIGRLLEPAAYGALMAMMSLYVVLGVPVSAAALDLARRISHAHAARDTARTRDLVRSSWRRSAVAAVLVILAYLLVLPYVKSYFGLTGHFDALSFGVMTALVVFTAPLYGFLQGVQHTRWLSVLGIMGHGGKALFGTLLVAAGWGVAGAFAGISITTLMMMAVGAFAIERALRKPAGGAPAHDAVEKRGAVHVIFLATLAFAMMSQLDVAMVKGFFPDRESGEYSAAAMLGKAIMYLPAALVVPLFPMVARNDALQRSSLSLLLGALAVSLALSALGTAVYYLAGTPLVLLLYGPAYADAGPLLEIYGLAMIPMSLIMVLEHFLLAKGRAFFAYLLMLGAPAQWLLMRHWHETPAQALWIVAGTAWVMLAVGVGWLGVEFARQSRGVSAAS